MRLTFNSWLCCLLLAAVGPALAQRHGAGEAERREEIAAEMERALGPGLFELWYPRAVDRTHGGFLSRFDFRWQPEGDQEKMIVTQGRHTWTAAKAAEFFPGHPDYLPAAAHGFAFLRDVMWDEEHGGFYDLVTREGRVIPERDGTAIKRAYGNAFGIYGLAAYFAASGDRAALELAQEAFRWLDRHSHDPAYGGYFQFLARDGTPYRDGYGRTPPKDQNSSIHLLEAFTELYAVWPDETLRVRLEEMLRLVRDTMTDERGSLQLFFHRDWTPVSYRDSSAAVREANYRIDHVSFGHDVETAFLLLEAAEALGRTHDPVTLRQGKKMVDNALRNGWDEEAGGLYDMAYYLPGEREITILERTKNWWAQAEALNTLLLMAELFPEDPLGYYDRFEQLWDYTKIYLIDDDFGGWYAGGVDEEPEHRITPKGHIWKGAYHDGRSLMRSIQRLRGEAE